MIPSRIEVYRLLPGSIISRRPFTTAFSAQPGFNLELNT